MKNEGMQQREKKENKQVREAIKQKDKPVGLYLLSEGDNDEVINRTEEELSKNINIE